MLYFKIREVTFNFIQILNDLNPCSHYKIFGKLNSVERSSGDEEEDEEWVTEEIVDVEHNKVYTREVAI